MKKDKFQSFLKVILLCNLEMIPKETVVATWA